MKTEKDKESKILDFEILAADVSGKLIIESSTNFCHNLLSNNKLLPDAEMVGGNSVYYKDKEIKINIKKIDLTKNSGEIELNQAFILTINGNFISLESFRIPLLSHLKSLGFESLYVLEDDVSLSIAKRLYPEIYKVESFLRKYLIKFFVTKLGPEWWKLTAGSEMQKKTNQRKNNELVFSDYIDNEIYLIDFGELGKLIHSQSTGNLSKEDILNKVVKLEETVEALVEFKKDIQTNYTKFFKATFKENNFQSKWEELEKIRHKIAHNNLFTLEEEEKGLELVKDLIEIMKNANDEIDKISFSNNDKQNVMNSFLNLEKISKENLLDELRTSVSWAEKSADGFVGLQNFVINILGNKGYDFQSTRDLIKELETDGLVEIYTYESDKNIRGVAAIKFKK